MPLTDRELEFVAEFELVFGVTWSEGLSRCALCNERLSRCLNTSNGFSYCLDGRLAFAGRNAGSASPAMSGSRAGSAAEKGNGALLLPWPPAGLSRVTGKQQQAG